MAGDQPPSDPDDDDGQPSGAGQGWTALSLPHRRHAGVGFHRLAGRPVARHRRHRDRRSAPCSAPPGGIYLVVRRLGRLRGRDAVSGQVIGSAAGRRAVPAQRRGLLPARDHALGRARLVLVHQVHRCWSGSRSAILIIFFLVAYRNPKMVPTKKQWLAESIYGFVRNNIAVDMIGHDGRAVRAVPHDAVLLHPADEPLRHHPGHPDLAELAHRVPGRPRGDQLRAVQLRRHPASTAFVKYFKNALIPPAPWFILPLLIPIEFFSTFIVRPFTLAAAALRQHVRRPHDPAGLHARRLRDAQRERLARAGLAAVLG